MKPNYNESLFNKMPVVGIMRNIPLDIIEEILPYYKEAGFTNIEITMNSENSEGTIKYLSQNHEDLNIGAGTVCNMEDLMRAVNVGASFIVTPILHVEVMKYCTENEIPIFPGAFTPLEIYNASNLGATAVKIFPATQLGASYIKDVLAPLNKMKLLPTGGVTVDNIESFFKAGAIGVGMGSSLFDKDLIESKNYKGLLNHFKEIANKVLKVK